MVRHDVPDQIDCIPHPQLTTLRGGCFLFSTASQVYSANPVRFMRQEERSIGVPGQPDTPRIGPRKTTAVKTKTTAMAAQPHARLRRVRSLADISAASASCMLTSKRSQKQTHVGRDLGRDVERLHERSDGGAGARQSLARGGSCRDRRPTGRRAQS